MVAGSNPALGAMEIDIADIQPVIDGWKIIEDTLVEAGLGRERAEKLSKAIVSRLAQKDVLLASPDQLRD